MRHLLGDLNGLLVALFLGNVLAHFPGHLDGDVDGDVLAALVGDLLALFLGHFDGDVMALLVGNLVALLLGNLSRHLERRLSFDFIVARWRVKNSANLNQIWICSNDSWHECNALCPQLESG
jgi:hypothetical protein